MASEAATAMADLSIAPAAKSRTDLVAEKLPYYEKRIKLFEGYASREVAKVEAAKAADVKIQVVLPDGKSKTAVKGVTTPMDIANEISKSLAKKCVVAKVDGNTWDLFRPLEADCALSLHSFDDEEGREVRMGMGVDTRLACEHQRQYAHLTNC